MNTALKFAQFIASLATELWAIFEYSQQDVRDPEEEKQLALNLVRRASDERMKRELGY